ncbi:MAG: bifunctional phosphoribosylaminoimidazolecarboxamide formyltransferase/IMP cyclohydrolase [Clostridiales bacterium]|nr:bifunctional phosphoribosylaminoimidazolecarboxamide formyltransferase/IMP cyclohydrolase [Clostridiales bacterium]
MKRALISVSDKTGIVSFARKLIEMDVEILSTGGTAKRLRDSGLKVIDVSEVTEFPECLDGRVKTLHPKIHGGILARRDKESHMSQLTDLGIDTIDFVIINLYPFKETIEKENVSLADAIENIDIGGPTMLRSAAKNYQDVTVIVDPTDYDVVIESLKTTGEVSLDKKYDLALKVFKHTAEYDTLIATYLRERTGDKYPETLTLAYEKVQDLRYGENPHQTAAFYREVKKTSGTLADAVQLHGKELSFNNINDANGALDLLKEFSEPTIVAVKHTNPCGVGSGIDLYDAYTKAYECDPQSIFGGIIAANREVDVKTAEEINKIFIEIVIAPSYSEAALEILMKKKNIRLMTLEGILDGYDQHAVDIKKVSGGILVQDINRELNSGDLEVVTERIPTENEMKALEFAWKVCKHTKSNGIVLSNKNQTLSIGPGQVSRIWALNNAIRNSFMDLSNSVMASDAFFPFEDCVKTAAEAGVKAIIQPGGSKNDAASIEMANKYGIAMVFTGMRHFKH